MKKLEKVTDGLFTELTGDQIRRVSAGSISVTECGKALDFAQDAAV
jgi:hypothetical protein